MAIADKLLQVNQVKQDIKTAIGGKGVDMTGVPFTGYPAKIANISGGGLTPEQEAKLDLIKSNGDGTKYLADNGVYKAVSGGGSGVDLDALPYMNYAANIYYQGGSQTLFSNGWTDHAKKTVYFDGDITFAGADSSLGFPLSFYTGAGIEEFYNLMESGGIAAEEAVKFTVDGVIYDATSLDSITNLGRALRYIGDVSGSFDIPTPVYGIVDQDNNPFMTVINTTNLGMPLGKALAFIDNESINNLKIESGFNHYYENGVIIPDGVEFVPPYALNAASRIDPIRDDFLENANIPLVIPNSVTIIGDGAFYRWESNNQPLVIPNSVTSIGSDAFRDWTSAKEFIMESETPPTIINNSFYNTNQAPFYVPNDSVEAYKTATNWSAMASRIFPMSDRLTNLPNKTSDLINDSDFTTRNYVDNKTTIKEQNKNTVIKFWTGSQAEYDSLGTKDESTLYFIEEE